MIMNLDSFFFKKKFTALMLESDQVLKEVVKQCLEDG